MKTLLLLRHAKSSWKDETLCDHDRPLNKRGQTDAPGAGQWLIDHNLVPDVVLSSTALRAQSTAKLMAESAGYTQEIELKPNLYHADADDFLATLIGLDSAVRLALVVGHNPGIEEFLCLLTGQHEKLPTAAVARIELPIPDWLDINRKTQGQLIEIWRPKERS